LSSVSGITVWHRHHHIKALTPAGAKKEGEDEDEYLLAGG